MFIVSLSFLPSKIGMGDSPNQVDGGIEIPTCIEQPEVRKGDSLFQTPVCFISSTQMPYPTSTSLVSAIWEVVSERCTREANL